jgi:hypothetical protein
MVDLEILEVVTVEFLLGAEELAGVLVVLLVSLTESSSS